MWQSYWQSFGVEKNAACSNEGKIVATKIATFIKIDAVISTLFGWHYYAQNLAGIETS
ncbi:unnamed protein product [Ixodes persulcatus]